MTVQEDFAYIAQLLNAIVKSNNEHTNYYKAQCGLAKERLENIKRAFEENVKHIEIRMRKNKNVSTGEMGDVEMDSTTQSNSMAVQQHFESIANLLHTIISGRDETTKIYNVQCKTAQQQLTEIKQKFDEKEKNIDSLKRKTEKMSTGEIVDVQTDETTSIFTLSAKQHDQGIEENNVRGQEEKSPIKEQQESKIIPKLRDGGHIQENKTVVANIKQHEAADDSIKSDRLKMTSLSRECEELKQKVSDLERQLQRSSKSASRHESDLVKEQQFKADHDELEKKFHRLTTVNTQLEENLQMEKKENIARNRRIEELTNRLSALAAYQLTKDNPQIADLSDQCRPTKLAEGLSQLYDNQWTDVFEIFDKKKKAERDIIDLLAHTIKLADRFCEQEKTEMSERILLSVVDEINNSKRSATDLPKSSHASKLTDKTATKLVAERYVKDLMKALAMESSQTIAQIFLHGPMKEVASKFKIQDKPAQLDTYAVEAAKLVWMMKVQQPPVEFLWVKPGSRFNNEAFKSFTKMGEIVDQCIWPAVLLHKGGPVLARGVAQGK